MTDNNFDTFWNSGTTDAPVEQTTTTTQAAAPEAAPEANKEAAAASKEAERIAQELADFSNPIIAPTTETTVEPTKEINTDAVETIKEAKKVESVKEEEENKFFANKAKLMHERSIFSTLTEEELSTINNEETYLEAAGKEIENKVGEQINSFVSRVGKEGKAYLDFIQAGGSTAEFFSKVAKPESMSLLPFETDEDVSSYAVKHLVNIEKKPLAEAQDYVKYLADNQKLKDTAGVWRDNDIKAEENARTALAEQRQTLKTNSIKQRQLEIESMDKMFTERDSIAGIQLKHTDKKIMGKYIAEGAYTTESGSVLSKFDKDLSDILGDPEKKAKLALLVKAGLNLDGFTNKAVSDTIKEKTSILMNTNTVGTPTGTGGQQETLNQNNLIAKLEEIL